MSEKPKRLTPKPGTLRELFLKSGNLCAFQGCHNLMMDAEGVFIGQVCHIEAAEEGGERFNPQQTNEQRRAPANLLLLCYEHHQVTNDEEKFPVSRMRKIKAEHEARFSSPDRAILSRLTDWTKADSATFPSSLERMNKVLSWDHEFVELGEAAKELRALVERLERIPVQLRQFIGAIAERMYRMEGTKAVQSWFGGHPVLLLSDFQDAYGFADDSLKARMVQLESYHFGCLDEIDTDFGPQPAVRLYSLDSGWPVWLDLAKFCEDTGEPMLAFVEDLDFARLDG